MGIIRTIIFYIIVFVIGSLILSWLIAPNSIDNLKNNINQAIHSIKIPNDSNIHVSIQYNDLYFPNGLPCSTMKIQAAASYISAGTVLSEFCKGVCGRSNMEYSSYDCKLDKLYCNCYRPKNLLINS